MELFIKSELLFVLAGLLEIGGGWLVWQWLREGRSMLLGAAGFAVLALYGVIPTLQPLSAFGRVYAAYGGMFIVLSLVWGFLVDRWTPDRYDLLGGTICLVGVAIMARAPRG